MLQDPVNHRQAVIHLANTIVVLPGTGAHAAKIETQGTDPQIPSRAHQGVHYLVVHGPALHGVGMTDHCQKSGHIATGQQRLKRTTRPFDNN